MGCNCGGRKKSAKAGRGKVATSEALAAARAKAVGTGSRAKPAQPQPAPPKTKKPARRPPPPGLASAKVSPYTVTRGDTMADIARRFGMTTKELVKFDGGTGVPNIARLRSRNAHIIHPGEVILVPRKGA